MEHRPTLNDLKIAREELRIHEKELEKCSADLAIAKNKLHAIVQSEERILKEAHDNLEEMMYAISHNIRKSVANILGISRLLWEENNLKDEEMREFLIIIIHAAESLNSSTEDLSKYIHTQKNNLKNIKE